jgi:type I restriction enzyme S subunit
MLFGKRRAYQRKVAVADFSGVCSGDIYVLETKDSKVLLPQSLPFICQTAAFFDHAVGPSAGSLSPRTNWTSLANFEFALPPLEEQRRFADASMAIEACLERWRDATNALELAESAVLNSFLAEATGNNVAVTRRAADATSISESARQRGWAFQRFGDLADVVSDGEHISPEFCRSGIPILSAKDVLNDGVDFSGARHITSEAAERSWRRCKPLNGDLLIVSRGATIGRSCIVRTDREFALMGSVIQVRMNEGRMRNDFCQHLLRSQQGQRQLVATSGNSAQQAIYLTDIAELFVLTPPLEQQDRALALLAEARAPRRAIERRRELLSALRTRVDGLLRGTTLNGGDDAI